MSLMQGGKYSLWSKKSHQTKCANEDKGVLLCFRISISWMDGVLPGLCQHAFGFNLVDGPDSREMLDA